MGPCYKHVGDTSVTAVRPWSHSAFYYRYSTRHCDCRRSNEQPWTQSCVYPTRCSPQHGEPRTETRICFVCARACVRVFASQSNDYRCTHPTGTAINYHELCTSTAVAITFAIVFTAAAAASTYHETSTKIMSTISTNHHQSSQPPLTIHNASTNHHNRH
jgi:hypothetical protein